MANKKKYVIYTKPVREKFVTYVYADSIKEVRKKYPADKYRIRASL